MIEFEPIANLSSAVEKALDDLYKDRPDRIDHMNRCVFVWFLMRNDGLLHIQKTVIEKRYYFCLGGVKQISGTIDYHRCVGFTLEDPYKHFVVNAVLKTLFSLL